MKTLLETISGPAISIDISEIAVIEMHGQRDSGAGFVNAHITLKSGATIQAQMTEENYDQLLLDWNQPEAP